MRENNERNSRKRLNALILLVAFTAVLLIVSTYAWFSTQRNVNLSNLDGTVKVAEGLEISLDGSKWSNTIDFSQYNNDQTVLKKLYGETDHNIIPTEMLPVSSNGTEGIDKKEIPFYRGVNTDTKVLSSIVQTALTKKDDGGTSDIPTTASDASYPGYYAIDIFLRNSGLKGNEVQGTAKETLQLSAGSNVTVKASGNSATGLQNTPRIALALYDGTADANATGAPVITGTVTNSTKITDVAMWEPNSNAHVDYIVDNFNNIKWKTGEAAKYIADTTTYKYTKDEKIPTYALTTDSVTAGSFTDLYDWSGTNASLSKQIALQTNNGTGGTDGINNLISVNSNEASIYPVGQSGKSKEFQILKNTVLRLRMYIWLEGQDPDCVNYASHGGGITLNLGLCKGEVAANAATTSATGENN